MAEVARNLDVARGMELLLKSLRADGKGSYMLIRGGDGTSYEVWKVPLEKEVYKDLERNPERLRLRVTKEEVTALLKEAVEMAWGVG